MHTYIRLQLIALKCKQLEKAIGPRLNDRHKRRLPIDGRCRTTTTYHFCNAAAAKMHYNESGKEFIESFKKLYTN